MLPAVAAGLRLIPVAGRYARTLRVALPMLARNTAFVPRRHFKTALRLLNAVSAVDLAVRALSAYRGQAGEERDEQPGALEQAVGAASGLAGLVQSGSSLMALGPAALIAAPVVGAMTLAALRKPKPPRYTQEELAFGQIEANEYRKFVEARSPGASKKGIMHRMIPAARTIAMEELRSGVVRPTEFTIAGRELLLNQAREEQYAYNERRMAQGQGVRLGLNRAAGLQRGTGETIFIPPAPELATSPWQGSWTPPSLYEGRPISETPVLPGTQLVDPGLSAVPAYVSPPEIGLVEGPDPFELAYSQYAGYGAGLQGPPVPPGAVAFQGEQGYNYFLSDPYGFGAYFGSDVEEPEEDDFAVALDILYGVGSPRVRDTIADLTRGLATHMPAVPSACSMCGVRSRQDYSFTGDIKEGHFYNSPLVKAKIVRGPHGLYGQIRLDRMPFEISVGSTHGQGRGQLALSHEFAHLADNLLKMRLTHDQVHSLGLLLGTEFDALLTAYKRHLGT